MLVRPVMRADKNSITDNYGKTYAPETCDAFHGIDYAGMRAVAVISIAVTRFMPVILLMKLKPAVFNNKEDCLTEV